MLRVLKVGTTGDVKDVVEDQLGWEVMSSCKVEMRLRYTRSVRESYFPYYRMAEGRFDTFGVRLEFLGV